MVQVECLAGHKNGHFGYQQYSGKQRTSIIPFNEMSSSCICTKTTTRPNMIDIINNKHAIGYGSEERKFTNFCSESLEGFIGSPDCVIKRSLLLLHYNFTLYVKE